MPSSRVRSMGFGEEHPLAKDKPRLVSGVYQPRKKVTFLLLSRLALKAVQRLVTQTTFQSSQL